MKDALSAFGSEIFRPLSTVVLPGAFALTPSLIAALYEFSGFRHMVADNHAEAVAAFIVAAVFSGLVCEDIGARLESWLDAKAGADHEVVWYSYLRQALRIEPVGHRYLRTLVLRLKFELGCSAAS